MSYNGVGLSTPRGSGTNGHIQRNWSHLRARDPLPRAKARVPSRPRPSARRRRVEVQCLELQVRLEDQESPALSEQEIEQQVDALRQRLLVQSQEAHGKERKGPIQPYERHELAQAKALADEKLRKALGISKDHVEGRAFDRVEQERLKEARKAEWERKEEEKRVRQEERHKHQQEVERLKQQHELEKSRLKRDYERRGAPPSGASEVPPPSRRSIADWRWYSKSPEAPALSLPIVLAVPIPTTSSRCLGQGERSLAESFRLSLSFAHFAFTFSEETQDGWQERPVTESFAIALTFTEVEIGVHVDVVIVDPTEVQGEG
ncbi:BQ2448_6706 [Microbotryum intermedium]|uniref:BQ2448_6706 protein n=1 Tax=Microbotryum intermedium TaxID=269621 RepID=A0A238FQW4_9BASI|nr:BQ2448_6706 [Microbotryum intermedium]